MKICYLGYLRIPTEKAHGFQIMKMCEAFASLGHEVELVIPKQKNLITENPFSYYGIKVSERLHISFVDVGMFDHYRGSQPYRVLHFAFHSLRFLRALQNRSFSEDTLFYTRNATIAWWCGVIHPGIPVVYEAHGVPRYFSMHRFFLRKIRMMVAITQGIVDDYRAKGYNGKMVVEADAADLAVFADMNERHALRVELGLPLEEFLAVYTGSFSLYSWKGVDVLIKAAEYLPENIRVVLVGGSPEEINHMKSSLSSHHFIFVPRVSREVVAKYLCAADVLVLPNTKGNLTSERYTSPLKLFEYMASGIPIVASDLSSIREVLDEKHACLVEPNNPLALAEGIKSTIADSDLAHERARRSREKVSNHTWHLRAERVANAVVW